jgi:putative Holliday junction resolvase
MRVLALDVGERRVGIAISDPGGILARPLQALWRGSREEDLAAIAALVAEHDVGLLVVGKPLSLNGTEGPQARRVARYAEALAEHLPVQVVSWDERYTTVEAQEIMRQQGRGEKDMRRARTNGKLDAVAAAVILQSYLDSCYHDSHYRDSGYRNSRDS